MGSSVAKSDLLLAALKQKTPDGDNAKAGSFFLGAL